MAASGKLLLGVALEISVDKAVKVTVHNGADVARLIARAGVLDQCVGHENVASNLRAPLNIVLNALDILNAVELLARLDLHKLGLEHP